MERNLKEVVQEAVQLPESDRATLAGLLFRHSIQFLSPMLKAAWSEEIKRHLAEVNAG